MGVRHSLDDRWLKFGACSLFEYDLVASLLRATFGKTITASRVVYVLVALSALYTLIGLFRMKAMKRGLSEAVFQFGLKFAHTLHI